VSGHGGFAAADAFVLSDPAAVLAAAEATFNASGQCIDDFEGFGDMLEDSGGGGGEPGPPGEASGCSGECHGFYS
jgi:hypothetical protein